MIPVFLSVTDTTTHIPTSTFADLALIVTALLGIIGIIGAVSAYFYKGRADALISLQEKEIKVLQDNNLELKEQNANFKVERLEFIAEQKRMKREIATLRSVITQPKQLNDLARILAAQHGDVMGKLTDIAEGMMNQATKKGK